MRQATRKRLPNLKNMDSKSIIWSDRIAALQFQEDLPKVVQVQDGYYDDNDETTLSSGDVLTLHVRKKVRSYKAISLRCEEISIPTSIAAKIEILPEEKHPKIYNTVEDLMKDGIDKVEWMHKAPWLKVEEGDILQIHEIVEERAKKSVKMSFVDKTQDYILVPLDYRSDFKPVALETLWLSPGKEELFNYPIRVKFIDESLKVNDENTNESFNLSTIADIGEVILQGFQETELFIASIKDEEDRIIVMKIPSSLDITVRGGVGIKDAEDDFTYANVCQEFNKRARLEQLDENNFDAIRIGNTEAAVERIYEVPPGLVDSDSESDEGHEYIEPAPELPTRQGRAPLRMSTPSSSEDDDDDEYEECDIGVNNNNNNNSQNQQNEGESDEEDSQQDYDDVCYVTDMDPPTDIKSGCCCFRNTLSYNTKSSTVDEPTPQGLVIPRTSPTNRYMDDRVLRSGETLEGNTKRFQIPSDLRCLSIDEVVECLRQINMAKHIETFQQSQIDGELLVTLDENMLVELGVQNSFEKRKLIKFIGGWRPETG